MIKKIYITLSIIVSLCVIMGFPNYAQADPAFVSDCVGEDTDSENCKEESDQQIHDEEQKDEEDLLVNEMSTGSLIFSFVKTGLVLLLILVLIYFLLKFLNKRNKLYNQVKALENLGGISVGQNKSIQIVRVGNKVYMIGVGESVELLEEINDENVIADLLDDQASNDFKGGQFFTSLFNLKTKENDSANEKTHNNFKNMFSNELDKLKDNRLKLKEQQKEKEG